MSLPIVNALMFAVGKLWTIYNGVGDTMKTIKSWRSKMIPFLGNRIQNAREVRGLIPSKAAEKVGVTRSTWSLYESENRSPSLDTLKVIAETLNVSADYLLGLKEKMTNLNGEEI